MLAQSKSTRTVRSKGGLVRTHVKGSASTTDGTGHWRLPGWMGRSLRAIAAELKFVDSGSVDVLLYCPDELVTRTARDAEVERVH